MYDSLHIANLVYLPMLLVYIDTNVFLDFYQSSMDRLQVFEDILDRGKSVVLTQQTVDEFRRNRVARLTKLADTIKKGATAQLHTTAVVQSLPGFEKWKQARDSAKDAANEIAAELTIWATDEKSDPVLASFEKLVAVATYVPTTPELVAKAQTRKILGQPPTSPDKYTVGDELNWECLLTGKTDLVIVSRDKSYLNNQSRLKQEYTARTGKSLSVVTDSLATGLEKIGKASKKIEDAEQSLPRNDGLDPFRDGLCIDCGSQLDEMGYEGSEGDSAWWLDCPKCHRTYWPTSGGVNIFG